MFASHSSLGRGSLSNCRASILCSEVHSLTSLQKGVNLSKPFQPATVCLSKIHWNILKPPNRRFIFFGSKFLTSEIFEYRSSAPFPFRATHKVPKLHLFKMKRKNRPPQLQVGKKIPNCYIRAFYKEPFLPFKKHDFVFRTWFGEVFVWVFEMLGLEIDLLFIKIIEFDFSWVDQCHVKCLFQTDNKVMKDKQIGHHQWFFGVAFWSTDGKLMVWIGGWGFNWGTLK